MASKTTTPGTQPDISSTPTSKAKEKPWDPNASDSTQPSTSNITDKSENENDSEQPENSPSNGELDPFDGVETTPEGAIEHLEGEVKALAEKALMLEKEVEVLSVRNEVLEEQVRELPKLEGLNELFQLPISAVAFVFHVLHERMNQRAVSHYSSGELRAGTDIYYISVGPNADGINITFRPKCKEFDSLQAELAQVTQHVGDKEAVYKRAWPHDHPDYEKVKAENAEAKKEHAKLKLREAELTKKCAKRPGDQVTFYAWDQLAHPMFYVYVNEEKD